MLTRNANIGGHRVAWDVLGDGPPLVFCHGTPWSSWLWRPYAAFLSQWFTVHLWDMPGYGQSSKGSDEPIDLGEQGAVFTALLEHWGLDRPHVIAHDYGGAVALRAHLLHDRPYASLALVDVVALTPWGSDYFRLVAVHADTFGAQPAGVHEGAIRGYIAGASHRGLSESQMDSLVAPWLGDGQAAFYRQIAAADERFTTEFADRLSMINCPTTVIWGTEDAWIPVDRAHRLAESIGHAELELVPDAGHLIQLDAPVALSGLLTRWLHRHRGSAEGLSPSSRPS